MFKEFYDKTKNIDATEYVNSAKASLNSFSSLLEKEGSKLGQLSRRKRRWKRDKIMLLLPQQNQELSKRKKPNSNKSKSSSKSNSKKPNKNNQRKKECPGSRA